MTCIPAAATPSLRLRPPLRPPQYLHPQALRGQPRWALTELGLNSPSSPNPARRGDASSKRGREERESNYAEEEIAHALHVEKLQAGDVPLWCEGMVWGLHYSLVTSTRSL